MSMKRVRELLKHIELKVAYLEGKEFYHESMQLELITKELKAAIAPDWHPASEPPDHNRVVWVIRKGSKTSRIAWFNRTVKRFVNEFGQQQHDATHWHEIEVPEPPEVNQ